MLTITKNNIITGRSIIDGVEVEAYDANFNSDNPSELTFSSYQIDRALYKENRDECRSDRAEFEDLVFEMQDELLAALDEDEDTSTETE